MALRNSSDALRAATDIGAELANHGCRIVIYSFSEEFIETRAAQGYLGTGKAKSKSIRLVYPQAPASLSLEIVRNFAVRLIYCAGFSISFYESLHNADGVVLVGGGRSTMVCGRAFNSRSTPYCYSSRGSEVQQATFGATFPPPQLLWMNVT